MIQRWAVSTPLLQDELLSSWLTRAALSSGCDPLTLTSLVWPGQRVWTRDLDRLSDDTALLALTNISTISHSGFKAATLGPTAATITHQPLTRLAVWPWVLALGSRNRRRRGGTQYCPACFRESSTPYYRKRWRFAWHTACATHLICLHDECPNCHAAIEPHLLVAEDADMAICATCKYDLRESPSVQVTSEALIFQSATDQVFAMQHGDFGGLNIPVSGWFELSRYFIGWLRRISLGKHQGLNHFSSAIGIKTSSLTPPATGLALELLPTSERAQLFRHVWRLIDSGSTGIVKAAKEASLTRQALFESRTTVPEALNAVFEALQSNPCTRNRISSPTFQRPRSKESVKRMYARLLRKLKVK